jgi:hypothetical protein
MTIYLEKNKQGVPTGVWIVEIRKMTGGVSKTIRQRTRDYSEAKRLEASLRGSAGRPARLPVAVQAPSFTTRLPLSRLPTSEAVQTAKSAPMESI